MRMCECEACCPPQCSCCQRQGLRLKGSIWHGSYRLCDECFGEWYDPHEGVDQTDPVSIGNYVRNKHGLGGRP